MRIAFFSWESLHSIPVGGVAVHVTELAAALQRMGNEVHVFTRMGEGQAWYEVVDGVHYHRCPFNLNPDFVTEIHNMCSSLAHHFFETENVSGGFDIVHAHDWLTVPALAEVKNARNKKAVFTIHSTEYGRCGNNFFDGQSKRIQELEWYGGYISDRVITVSHKMKEEIMWIYHIPDWKIAVIYNGVNLRRFDGYIDPSAVKMRWGIGPLDPTCLFVGRMVHQKGPDLLLEAIPSVLSEFPAAKFVFVGDGYLRESLEHRAWELGISHACRFLGHISEWDLIDLYRACDTVCVPSRNEPFGIVILEAWAAGKPVIVTHNGFDFVWHDVNGLKVYDNPNSITWGIKTIFWDFERAREMGRNGRSSAESFSWDSIARKTMEVYEEIC
ncbi:MAG: glycosyltransferase family 4 protein [Candidatus Syntropharchaeia archaeon]